MNKKLLSAAVLAGLAGTASAVSLNHDGMGQVLLYPYYTTVGGKITEIHVTNTTNETKAIKVRFNEGGNTWEVRDFNLYLSPYDVWTAVIDLDKDGKPQFRTQDSSCTVPQFKDVQTDEFGQEWKVKEFTADYVSYFGDKYDAPRRMTDREALGEDGKVGKALTKDEHYLKRIKEGHIEMIEMGVINDADLQAAIKHNNVPGNKAVPANCQFVEDQFIKKGGMWFERSDTTLQAGLSAPTGGLMGSGTILDLAKGSMLAYEPTAIEGFYLKPVHARPGQSQPNLYGQGKEGTSPSEIALDGLPFASNVSYTTQNNQVYATQWPGASEALAAVLMTEGVYNEVYSYGDFGTTDWVITFPNKHAFVNPDTSDTSVSHDGTVLNTGQFGYGKCVAGTGRAPFANCFGVPLTFETWDEEEYSKEIDPAGIRWSPVLPEQAPDVAQLLWEVNVLKMSAAHPNNVPGEAGTRSVFQSFYSQDVEVPHSKGWAHVNFLGNKMTGAAVDPTTGAPTGVSHVYDGYPAIGFAAVEIKSPNVKQRFAAAYNHKYKRNISTQ